MGFRDFCAIHSDFIELARGYLGTGLITWDACTGWTVTNFIFYYFIEMRWLF